MQKSICKAMFLLFAIATLRREVLATPIITQVSRFVRADVNLVSDTDSSNALGSVDLTASASDFGDEAQATQQSTIDALGFSYESAFETRASAAGSMTLSSFLTVTYNLDAPFAYELTFAVDSLNGRVTPNWLLNGKGLFPPLASSGVSSGVLQPGAYTFNNTNADIFIVNSTSSNSMSASLHLTPLAVPEGDLPGYGLLLSFAIGGCAVAACREPMWARLAMSQRRK